MKVYRTGFSPVFRRPGGLYEGQSEDGENDDEDWISLGFEGGMTTMVMLIKL